MVYQIPDSICDHQYCGLFFCTHAVRHRSRRGGIFAGSDLKYPDLDQILQWTCGGGIYHSDPVDFIYRKHYHDQFRHHRLLYFQNL